MAHTVAQVRHALLNDLHMDRELISLAGGIASHRDASKGINVMAWMFVSGISASGIYQDVLIGPYTPTGLLPGIPTPATSTGSGSATTSETASDIDTGKTASAIDTETSSPSGTIISGYPLDEVRQVPAMAQLAAFVFAYFGENGLAVRVGVNEVSKDSDPVNHVAVAGTIVKDSPTGWIHSFVINEENMAP